MARTTYTFYYLHDPRNEEVGYVGMTTEPIQRRIRRHIQEATEQTHSPESDKNKWIRDLLDAGLKPRCQDLEVTAYRDAAHAAQRREYWIAKMNEEGKALTNMTTGGLGTPGLSIEHTEETKEKLSEAAIKFGDESLEVAIEMRKEGKTYKEIYEHLGMSRSNFYKEYKDKVAEACQ
jgi:hypothetical protein